MHIALVNGARTPPSSGLNGTCPVCERDMVAKCGDIRVHHWAHRGRRVCDHWWETETEWHRNWKNKFDIGWHEVIALDDAGEKHIADVRTPLGITVEFQYSHLRPEERASREAFHKNLVWVVSGTRLQRDFKRFLEGMMYRRETTRRGIFVVSMPDQCFPANWLNSSVPVFFDFLLESEDDERTHFERQPLWCLFPGRAEGHAVLGRFSRDQFVEMVSTKPALFDFSGAVESLAASLRQERQAQVLAERYRTNYMLARAMARQTWRPRGRRRF